MRQQATRNVANMDNANFIPLGIKNSEGAVSGPVPPPPKSKRTKEVVWGPRVIEQTKGTAAPMAIQSCSTMALM